MPVFFRFFRRRVVFAWAMMAWSLAVAAGFAILTAYSARPGGSLSGPERWPEESAAPRPDSRPTLLVFAHPRCPCTRATLEELAQILEQSPTRPAAEVFFFQPLQPSPAWDAEGPLWQLAEKIPGVTVHADPEGAEARRFGALTSGQTLLFDATGRLLFRGGITPGRGEHGANPGSERIMALLADGLPQPTTPVFGCPIFAAGGIPR